MSLALAASAAFVLAVVSAVAGFGGGVLLLPVFEALFGLRVAVPALTLVQLISNGSRVGLNWREIDRRVVCWFALGAVPSALLGGLVFAAAPLAPLQRLLGVFLIVVVVWRRSRPAPPRIRPRAFVGVGAGSGLGSALLGSVGPLTAPFFLAEGLTRGAYIGTEAASALTMHATKLLAYGVGDILTPRVLMIGAAMAPATIAGTWVGRRLIERVSAAAFVLVVEAGLVVAAVLLVLGV